MTATIDAPVATTVAPRERRRFADRLRQLWTQERGASVWALVLLLVVLIVVIGPFFAQSSAALDPIDRLQGASAAHWFGTDDLGRDILSRVISAGRVSLALGAVVTVIATLVGGALGLTAGYYRRVDGIIMRIMDAMLAFPPLVLAIALVVFLGNGATSEIIALTVVFIPYLARVARSSAIAVRERTFVTAARSSGLSGPKILVRHVLPNAIPAILVQMSFIYAFTLLSDAALSFLGLGVAAPTPTWGNMVSEAQPYITRAPSFIVIPGVAIVIVVMALNFIGDGVRNMLDPSTQAVLNMRRRRLGRPSTRLAARSRGRS